MYRHNNYRSNQVSGLTDADRAAMRRRLPMTLARWKSDAKADDDIIAKFKSSNSPNGNSTNSTIFLSENIELPVKNTD